MRIELERIVSPLALLTSLPISGRSMRLPDTSYGLFPVVGLLIGGALLAIDYLASLAVPTPAASAVVVVALVVLTGALHLDGLADSADGLFGGRDRAHRLAIMRDSRNGAFGFVAVAVVLLLKWAVLVSLGGWLRVGSLLLVPAVARWSVLPAITLFPSARHNGMAHDLQARVHWLQTVLGSAVVVGLSLAIFWPGGIVLAGAGLLLALAVGGYVTRRLGGVTGDIFGAIVELNEAALLLVVATSASRPWLT